MIDLPPRVPGRPKGSTAPSGDTVRRVRLALGLSQKVMGEKLLGMKESGVARCERLNRLPESQERRDKLAQLAKEAGVTYP